MKAIVVGGGPAGLSSSIGLLRLGFEVQLFEQRAAGTSRVCGTYLNRAAVSHLRWLGVMESLVKAGAVDIPKTNVFLFPGFRFPFPSRWRSTSAMASPRPVLEKRLAEKAREEGALLHFGTSVLNLKKQNTRWIATTRNDRGEHTFHGADLIVLADGRFSLAKGSHEKSAGGWFGWNATFSAVPQKSGDQSMHFFKGGYVGVVTYSDGTSNVCGLMEKTPASIKIGDSVLREALLQSQSLRDLLAGAVRVSEWRGVGPLIYSDHRHETSEYILAGDAAAVGDPFLGEGIGRALGAGPLIVAAGKAASKNGGDTVRELIRAYNRLWDRRYRASLWKGKALRWGLSIFSKRINLWTPQPTEITPSETQKSASGLNPTPSSTTPPATREFTNS